MQDSGYASKSQVKGKKAELRFKDIDKSYDAQIATLKRKKNKK